eukprot:scaffold1655_cov247-Pinguiococcus_pyrenoidosus.AAC.25
MPCRSSYSHFLSSSLPDLRLAVGTGGNFPSEKMSPTLFRSTFWTPPASSLRRKGASSSVNLLAILRSQAVRTTRFIICDSQQRLVSAPAGDSPASLPFVPLSTYSRVGQRSRVSLP